jgi:hypothetical protein
MKMLGAGRCGHVVCVANQKLTFGRDSAEAFCTLSFVKIAGRSLGRQRESGIEKTTES